MEVYISLTGSTCAHIDNTEGKEIHISFTDKMNMLLVGLVYNFHLPQLESNSFSTADCLIETKSNNLKTVILN